MKILIAPDKFKGSLTAIEVCDAIEEGIRNILPTAEVVKLPLADGGEESLEALESSLKFKRISVTVNNPLFEPIKSWYGFKDNVAYVEMAKASGLQLLTKKERNPNLTTSYGTGELIVDAIKRGVKKIYLFIGGSATNDAGIGIASALGYKFFDSENKELKPIGESLIKVQMVEYLPKVSLSGVQITVLTDVQNPFYGEDGAAHVYAEQKGADKNSIFDLDKGLRNISDVFKESLDENISNLHGSGAAGGIGGGMIAFFNAELRSGIDEVFKMLNFDKMINDCDCVITGEGKFDSQTLEGKVVKGVIDKAKEMKKSIGVVCGATTFPENKFNEMGITVKQIKTVDISLEESIKNASELLVKTTSKVILELTNKS